MTKCPKLIYIINVVTLCFLIEMYKLILRLTQKHKGSRAGEMAQELRVCDL